MPGAMVPTERLYAFIADGERGALIDPSGGISWMCMPSWDGDAFFTSLLGGAGIYSVSPQESYVWGGYYESGTLVWRNRWTLTGGPIVECHDALAFPGDPERALLLRRLSAEKGEVRMRIVLDIRPEYGKKRIQNWKQSEQGIWSGHLDPLQVQWHGAADARFSKDEGLVMEVTLAAGQHHDLLLALSCRPMKDEKFDPDALWSSTRRAWELSAPKLDRCAGQRDALHAYVVLRGLTTKSGGMASAATTSLPERSDSGRNYDYRYVWIRDQCWTGQAMAAIAPDFLLSESVRFIQDRLLEDGPDLRPVYTPSGEKVPAEKDLSHLPGYPGGAQNHHRQQGRGAVSAGCLRRGASALCRRRPARHTGCDGMAGGGSRGECH